MKHDLHYFQTVGAKGISGKAQALPNLSHLVSKRSRYSNRTVKYSIEAVSNFINIYSHFCIVILSLTQQNKKE